MSAAPPGFTLHRDSFDRLVLTLADGAVLTDVDPVRSFPLTAPQEHIALLSADGREVVQIRRLSDLPDDQRRLLEEELAARAFVPVIQRIVHSSGPFAPCTWKVETDRGAVTVSIDSEDDVRRLGEHAAQITDGSGLRFLIPDDRQLDAASQRHLSRLL